MGNLATWAAVVRASGEVALTQGSYWPLGAGEAFVGTFAAESEADAWQLFTDANPISQSATTVLGMDAKTHRVHPDAVTRLRVPVPELTPRSYMATISRDSDPILAVEVDEVVSSSKAATPTPTTRQTKNAKGRKR